MDRHKLGFRSRMRRRGAITAAGIIIVLVVSICIPVRKNEHDFSAQNVPMICLFRYITKVPCPTCGFTTSFALMGKLRVRDAFANQPFAAVLYVGFVAVLGTAFVTLATGKDYLSTVFEKLTRPPIFVVILVFLFVSWIYKIIITVVL